MEQGTKEEIKQTTEDKILNLKKRKNIKIYKVYRALAYDLLFYYAIIFLFLTMEKGLTAAQILQFDAFYILFKFAVQIPMTLLIQRVGKRRSIIIANFMIAIHILIIMFAPDFNVLLISQLLCAMGFIIKATCETDMLYDSIDRGEKRGHIFAKIDGKATSKHYYIEAISAVIAGFLFVINPYIPMVLCFIMLLMVSIISTNFEDIHTKVKKDSLMIELKNLRYSFKSIFRSKRLMSLLLFNAFMVGMIKILQSLRSATLVEVDMPEQYFGVIFAVLGIISGIAAKNQHKIHERFRNKTLTFIGVPTAISCLLLGVLLMFDIDTRISIPIILILFAIQYIMKGPYFVLIKRYFNNFTNSEKRVKIATANNFVENIIASMLLFGSSVIIDNLPISNTLMILGIVATVIVVILLDVMKHTVGLKMEEYSNKEIL